MFEVDGLSVSFPSEGGLLEAVSGVSFGIERGEIAGLVGESGCGKSVTAFSVAGLVPRPGIITAGRVRLSGTDLLGLSEAEWQKVRGKSIGVVFQDAMAALNPVLPVGRQIADTMEAHLGLSRREAGLKAVEMLERVGIQDPAAGSRAFPHEFSGGMRQRVMIAQALSCKPQLLIADEPTTALDVTVQAEILNLIRSLRDDLGMGVLFITHDLGVIARIADSVNVMYGGRIVESGTVDDVLTRSAHPYTRGLVAATPRIDVDRVPLPIPGRVPGLAERTRGCQFRSRCAHAMPVCESQPELAAARAPAENRHKAACWALDESGNLPRGRVETAAAPPVAGPDVASKETRTVVSIEDLTVEYRGSRSQKGTLAVNDVTLRLQAGETLGIVGESGSGKSSIARALVGIVPAAKGSIKHGPDTLRELLKRKDRAWRRRVQMVFQDPYASLDPAMTVGRSIAEGVRVHGLVPRRKVDAAVGELLTAVGLDPSVAQRYPRQFSGGQRQRVAIARALAVEPDVIVCDEAVSSLDVSVQAQILELLERLQRERGIAYIFISHDLGVVRQVADRVLVLYRGKIVEVSDDDGVFRSPLHPYTAALLAAVPVPDPEVERQRRAAAGSTPAEARPAVADTGCPYRHRCPRAQAICVEVDPALESHVQGRAAACHFPLVEGRIPVRSELRA